MPAWVYIVPEHFIGSIGTIEEFLLSMPLAAETFDKRKLIANNIRTYFLIVHPP